jgi:hypothetical protein
LAWVEAGADAAEDAKSAISEPDARAIACSTTACSGGSGGPGSRMATLERAFVAAALTPLPRRPSGTSVAMNANRRSVVPATNAMHAWTAVVRVLLGEIFIVCCAPNTH